MHVKEKKTKKVNPVAAFLWKDKKRRAKNFYFLLVVLLCIITAGMGYITEKLDLMSTGDDLGNIGSDITQEVIYDEEELAIMDAIDSAGSLNDFLYQPSSPLHTT